MSEELTFNQKIIAIQSELKAPKNQFNNFGKYKYRSCEDILEGVKPLLSEYGLLQRISDDIVQVRDRYYIKAIVTVLDGKNEMQVSAFAREPENKKGMDHSQITGTASSYARKYALNGMWLIDDTKDADTDEHEKQKTKKKSKPVLNDESEKWEKAVHSVAKGESNIEAIQKHYTLSEKDKEKLVAEAMEFSNSLS
ncbi:ERF family protein [Gracilimonas sp.]|uniref:ERF family protein n=1 Tax=Gracilimonas sp. TaxID=1974203 RepID=UPI002870F233|nr:ERF family protein [Gracilimonas sp.]